MERFGATCCVFASFIYVLLGMLLATTVIPKLVWVPPLPHICEGRPKEDCIYACSCCWHEAAETCTSSYLFKGQVIPSTDPSESQEEPPAPNDPNPYECFGAAEEQQQKCGGDTMFALFLTFEVLVLMVPLLLVCLGYVEIRLIRRALG